MKAPFYCLAAGLILLFLIASACSLLTPTPPSPADQDALFTQAAQTIVAQLTLTAVNLQPTPSAFLPTETGVPPTDLPAASNTPTSTQAPPTPTPIPPSPTPVPPTPTPVPPTPTPTPIPCNWARFVEDISVKDGTVFTPNSIFTKTWRLQNIGTCTWTGDYHLIFSDGDRMEGPRRLSFSESVDPGESVLLSVELVAPDEPGRYRGSWQLGTASGDPFGIGADAESPFWVEIKVIQPDKYAYDFAASYCAAKWRSDSGRLECPGNRADDDGFAVLLDRPVIEKGRLENETALWTNPEDKEEGWVQGEYPDFEVEQGMRFKAIVGCLDDSPDCDVVFRLNYRIGEGEIKTLWEAREVYDDTFTRVDVDLSPLAGEEVQFILAVFANGSPDDDQAFWLVPRIVD